jgi:hypothetical protein
MSRKKRSLFRELLAGIRAMRDHAEGEVELRTSRVSPTLTSLEADGTRRAARSRHRGKRPSVG